MSQENFDRMRLVIGVPIFLFFFILGPVFLGDYHFNGEDNFMSERMIGAYTVTGVFWGFCVLWAIVDWRLFGNWRKGC